MNRTATILVLALINLTCCQHGQQEHNGTGRGHRSEALDDNNNTCGVEDGTQSATVDYTNAETGYSATYTLDVEVENCQVVQIDFNNGGYLDGDHIDPADIDENGDALVEDDRGRSFEVHLQK